MKKIFVLIGAAMTMAVSCQKESKPVESLEFTAGIEDVTKTCLSTERRVLWQAGDEVAVNGAVYSAAPIAENPTLAKLTKVSGAEPTSPFTAVYPASVWDGGKLVMPAVQKYDPDGISNVPMYATGTASFLEFKNIFAVLKVTVPSSTTVKEIRVSSDMVMNGEFSVVADVAVMAKTENIKAADRELVLDCGAKGVAGTVFHIAIPAGDYSAKHLTVCVVDSKGEEYGMGTNQGVGVYVPRNTVSAVSFRGGYPVYRDGAYFGVPTKIDGLWWAPVQCGYDEELYKYGKIYQWGRYDGGGYKKDGDSKSDAGPVIQTDVYEGQTTDPRPDATNITGLRVA